MENAILKEYNLSMYKDIKIRHYYSENDEYYYDEFKINKQLEETFTFDYYDLEETSTKNKYSRDIEKDGTAPNQLIYDVANKNEIDYWSVLVDFEKTGWENDLIDKNGINFSGKIPSKWKSLKEFGFIVFYIIFTVFAFYFVATKVHIF